MEILGWINRHITSVMGSWYLLNVKAQNHVVLKTDWEVLVCPYHEKVNFGSTKKGLRGFRDALNTRR